MSTDNPLDSGYAIGGAVRGGTALLSSIASLSSLTSFLGGTALTKGSVQRAYNWEFLPPGFGLLTPELIGQYCQEIDFGEYSMADDNKIQYGSETRGYAGFFNVPKVRMKFVKPNPDVVFTYFDTWKRKIIDLKGFYGVKNDYALSSYILIEDTTKNVTAVVKMMGTFPTKFPNHSFSYGRDEAAVYEIEMNVDHIEFL